MLFFLWYQQHFSIRSISINSHKNSWYILPRKLESHAALHIFEVTITTCLALFIRAQTTWLALLKWKIWPENWGKKGSNVNDAFIGHFPGSGTALPPLSSFVSQDLSHVRQTGLTPGLHAPLFLHLQFIYTAVVWETTTTFPDPSSFYILFAIGC